MKAERPDGSHEPSNRDKRQAKSGAKPKQTHAHGPLGFGSVLKDVKQPGVPVDAGTQAALAMGAVPTAGIIANDQSFGVHDSVDALQSQDQGSASHQLQTDAATPMLLGKVTPGRLLDVVVDESTKLAISEASKEIHVELEPEHLGPLVVSITKDTNGRLDVRFRAKQADAARMLESGSELLRERLGEAGFANANVVIAQDAELVLTPN